MSDGNSNEAWLLELRRRLAVGSCISGVARPCWPDAPLKASDLAAAPEAMRARMRAPQGLPPSWLGARLEVVRRLGGKGQSEDARASSRVAAYPLLPLQGLTFEVTSVEDIPCCMRGLMEVCLPGFDWWIPKHWDGPFLKYGILHNSLPAPPNLATGEAMAIEVYGTADTAMEIGSDEWVAAWNATRVSGSELLGVRFPTRVVVHVATYSNVRYPGVGVPFYM